MAVAPSLPEFRVRHGEHLQNDPARVAVVKKMSVDQLKEVILTHGFEVKPNAPMGDHKFLVGVVLTNRFCERKYSPADGWFPAAADLVALFGDKFERRTGDSGAVAVDETRPLPGENRAAYERRMREYLKRVAEAMPEGDAADPLPDFSKMSVESLKDYARQESVDLRGATSRDAIIKVLQSALVAA